jgi:aconitase A
LELNIDKEFERNQERYEFLRWGQRRSTTSESFRRAPASSIR